MGRKTLPITLTPEQDAHLRAMEHDPSLPRQTRTRAQIVRLAAQGVDRATLAAYTGYHPQTLQRILRRFRQHGADGLHERPRTGRQPKWTPHATALLHACLQVPRTWTCTHLQQTLMTTLGVRFGRETLRLQLQRLGYRWQRTRYVPARPPDPDAVAVFEACLDAFKKGRKRGRSFYGTWRRRGLA